jgi:hypothetical protein
LKQYRLTELRHFDAMRAILSPTERTCPRTGVFPSTVAPWNPYPPLPREAVRDLLGITRAMYRAKLAEQPRDVVRLQALEDVGRELRAALRGSHGHPGTIQHQYAWEAAERATRALGELVGESMSVAPLVRATCARVKREPLKMG